MSPGLCCGTKNDCGPLGPQFWDHNFSMKLSTVIIASAAAVAAQSVSSPPEQHSLINDEIVASVVQDKGSAFEVWEASQNPLNVYRPSELMTLFGTHYDVDQLNKPNDLKPGAYFVEKGILHPNVGTMPSPVGPFPRDFDARIAYPQCKHPVRNQEHCGSCWAFSVAETWADNACVNNTGSSSSVVPGEQFSVEQILACDHFGPNAGCKGGIPGYAWDWVKDQGLVTEQCFPYDSFNMTVDACPPEVGPDISICPGGKTVKWAPNKCTMEPATLSVQYNDSAWMNAIMKLGALQTDYMVFPDFLQYKTGVYKHTNMSQQILGGHAIKVIGWGIVNKTNVTNYEQPYWTVQNSWGEKFGEEGYFRIWRDRNLSHRAYMGHAAASACGQKLPEV
jgi:cathepsin B